MRTGQSQPTDPLWHVVPGGPFTMGSADSDPDVAAAERPAHRVSVDTFWMARYPVSNDDWRRFVHDGGYREPRWWTALGWAQMALHGWQAPRTWKRTAWRANGPGYPVTGITWYEAVAFTRWCAERLGCCVRLPSEAEWEKAARGEDGRRFPSGEALHSDVPAARGDANRVGPDPIGRNRGATSPYGIEDLVGNVYAWTLSRWGPAEGDLRFRYPYDKRDGRENLDSDDLRVVRGGAWSFPIRNARCAYRGKDWPGDAFDNLGVRLIASTPPSGRHI